MQILFGMKLDRVEWVDQGASLGQVKLGPRGLIQLLSTRLGLVSAPEQSIKRINAWYQRLLVLDHKDAWFHESFQVDPWSTAIQLLQWRDELVEAGWNGQAFEAATPRLTTLSEMESVDILMPQGFADQFSLVLRTLKEKQGKVCESISLVEPLSSLPHHWQSLFGELARQGTRIEELVTEEKEGVQDSVLGQVKSVLKSLKIDHLPCPDDDSLLLLHAENEWEAAEQVALWLSAHPDKNRSLAIVCGRDTLILDEVLHRYGLPRIGQSLSTSMSEVRQLLALVMANAWKPVDIRSVVELLSMSIPLFPWKVTRHLLTAVKEEPGLGGREWDRALEKIESENEENERLLQDIALILEDHRFDEDQGIPKESIRERCNWLVGKLAPKLSHHPELIEAIHQARTLADLSKGKGFVPRFHLDRILQDLADRGGMENPSVKEAAPWRIFSDPGQITGPYDEILWWAFNEPIFPRTTYWTPEENRLLEAKGIRLEAPKVRRERETAGWKRALDMASNRFLGIHISTRYGEMEAHHPLWDVLIDATRKLEKIHQTDLVNLIQEDLAPFYLAPAWALAGRQADQVAVDLMDLPTIQPVYQLSRELISPPQRLSYSQMSDLISCPFKWTLERVAGLRAFQSELTRGNLMMGRLIHRIVEELYGEEDKPTIEDVKERAGFLFDELLPSMASELMLRGKSAEKFRQRRIITEAITHMHELIELWDLQVEAVERQVQGLLTGASKNSMPFKGYVDLVLRRSDGTYLVFDVKYTSSERYRRTELENGMALQLALYAWMLEEETLADQVDAGYFLPVQKQFLTHSHLAGILPVNAGHELRHTLSMAIKSLSQTLERLLSGRIEVIGVLDRQSAIEQQITLDKVRDANLSRCLEEDLWYASPPCNFCDFAYWCQTKGRM